MTVNCATDKFTVGGTVSGLANTVVLGNENGPDLFVNVNGKFAFPETLESRAAYDVRVRNHPIEPAQFCAVTSGTGNVAAADVT